MYYFIKPHKRSRLILCTRTATCQNNRASIVDSVHTPVHVLILAYVTPIQARVMQRGTLLVSATVVALVRTVTCMTLMQQGYSVWLSTLACLSCARSSHRKGLPPHGSAAAATILPLKLTAGKTLLMMQTDLTHLRKLSWPREASKHRATLIHAARRHTPTALGRGNPGGSAWCTSSLHWQADYALLWR
jgi:hypothetical protein